MADEDTLPYPLYASTYNTYRLAPLYNGTTPILATLQVHARRMRDTIVGDKLRGIQIATELSGRTEASYGTFKACTWELLGNEDDWAHAQRRANAQAAGQDEDEISTVQLVTERNARGVMVRIHYEKAMHTAILLGEQEQLLTQNGFTHLPLLLLRMPGTLKEAFLDYLTTTFDTRITSMKLRPSFLSSTLEAVIREPCEQALADLQPLSSFGKGLQIQLSFPASAPNLRSIDVQIHESDILDFYKQGRKIQADGVLDQHISSDYVQNEARPSVSGPFTAALAVYLQQHLALDFRHPAVTLSKFVIGQYVFSGDGKVKILGPSDGARTFWNSLLQEAIVERLPSSALGKRGRAADKAPATGRNVRNRPPPVVASSAVLRRVRQPSERVPTDPPPPYELHDPAYRDDLDGG